MKRKTVFLGAALAAGALGGCGGGSDHNGGGSGQKAQAQSLDTAQVLMLAQSTNEASSPFAVNEGALTLTDTSETSAPIDVNSM